VEAAVRHLDPEDTAGRRRAGATRAEGGFDRVGERDGLKDLLEERGGEEGDGGQRRLPARGVDA
jgi:hypothetical protein